MSTKDNTDKQAEPVDKQAKLVKCKVTCDLLETAEFRAVKGAQVILKKDDFDTFDAQGKVQFLTHIS